MSNVVIIAVDLLEDEVLQGRVLEFVLKVDSFNSHIKSTKGLGGTEINQLKVELSEYSPHNQ